jgi:hypothetical protein
MDKITKELKKIMASYRLELRVKEAKMLERVKDRSIQVKLI